MKVCVRRFRRRDRKRIPVSNPPSHEHKIDFLQMSNGHIVGAVAAASIVLAWRWRRHVGTWKVEDFLAAALFPLALTSALLLFLKTPFRDSAAEIPSLFAYAPSRLLLSPRA